MAGVRADPDIPLSYNGALKSHEASNWQVAISDEIKALEKNKTWETCIIPPGREALDYRWAFAKIPSNLSESLRYKTRLVVRGANTHQGLVMLKRMLQLRGT